MSPSFFHINSDDLIKVIWPNLIREKEWSVREGEYPDVPFHSLVCTGNGKEAKSNNNPESSKPHTQSGSLLWKGMVIVCVLMTVRHLGPFFKALFWGLWFYPSNPTIQNPPRTGQAMSWQVRWHPVNWSPMALENRCQQAPWRGKVQEKSWHYNFKSSGKEDFRSYLPNTTFSGVVFLKPLNCMLK